MQQPVLQGCSYWWLFSCRIIATYLAIDEMNFHRRTKVFEDRQNINTYKYISLCLRSIDMNYHIMLLDEALGNSWRWSLIDTGLDYRWYFKNYGDKFWKSA